MKTALVVPTIREHSIKMFLDEWDLCGEHWDDIFVIEDNPQKSFDLHPHKCHHLSWAEIDKDLGSDSWIISRRDSAIRSYGFLAAHRNGADIIFTLDDDCLPLSPRTMDNSFVWRHTENLTNTPKWIESIPGQRTRGLPYKNKGVAKNVMLSVGFWEGNPDFDAIQTLSGQPQDIVLPETRILPLGQYTPICGMNMAFKREMTPLMYFPLQGDGYPFRRFDDIWMGVFAKKICDHIGWMISTGWPNIFHSKASDPFVNLVKEAPGIKFHETFWEKIDAIKLYSQDPIGCLRDAALAIQYDDDEYVGKVSKALKTWARIFLDDYLCQSIL